ncbi:NAD(P)-dependent oxidoreductase [Parafrankia discariae]|uniref:NAD(P)-dependent oxidoreductase n=1 Tax=Parafrankia discariae TaxID=365528 RepID=UPI0003A89807|nr:NAD(P)-dependent oxidoreductase [Parafrankia discariae]
MAGTRATVGFVGLGSMGGALAANLVAAGFDVVAHDAAGPDRVPAGAAGAADVAEVAGRADTVVCSLPDGAASEQVAGEIVALAGRRAAHVVDTSTVGVAAARRIAARLAGAGVGYVDAPVSGGVAGARARTITVMFAGSAADCAAVTPVLAGLSDRRVRVGDEPGLAQALKLANNFLSATALAATSEAIAFGTAAGLDPVTMLEALNGASGRSSATGDKFPNHVLTGRYAAGFTNSLMAKDVALYLAAVRERDGAVGDSDNSRNSRIGSVTAAVWERFAVVDPGVDFTRIYPFVKGT